MVDIESIFIASVSSVGTAFTLAFMGMYLQKRGFIVGGGKKTLALIAQQVTIPAFLFSRIVYCSQDSSTDPCPNVANSLEEVWMLLFWPIYVVGAGLLVGYAVARVTSTPPRHIRSVLVSCALSNSTGVPITLLTVIHSNFPSNSQLGKVDPTLFLSVYLILYPALQWGIGGFLLAPAEENELSKSTLVHTAPDRIETKRGDDNNSSLLTKKTDSSSSNLEYDVGLTISFHGGEEYNNRCNKETTTSETTNEVSYEDHNIPNKHNTMPGRSLMTRNVLNNECIPSLYQYSHMGIQDTDASMYVSNTNLLAFPSQVYLVDETAAEEKQVIGLSSLRTPKGRSYDTTIDEFTPIIIHSTSPAPYHESSSCTVDGVVVYDPQQQSHIRAVSTKTIVPKDFQMNEVHVTLFHTICKIMQRCLQPPVIGALSGLFVASVPWLRNLLVDTISRSHKAPFQWLFDGIYSVGLAAVPINMIILGCNLTLSSKKTNAKTNMDNDADLPKMSTIGIVIGKMVIMPIIGIFSCFIFKTYFWIIPEEISAPFYLVAMIVFITPTANNVMVMVELSGQGAQGGIARAIGYQYAASPILLSVSVTAVVSVAASWMKDDIII